MDPKLFNQQIEPLLHRKKKSVVKYGNKDGGHDESYRLAARAQTRPCEDCGLSVTGRVVEIYRSNIGTDNEHWRKNCQICRKKTPLDIKIINRVV